MEAPETGAGQLETGAGLVRDICAALSRPEDVWLVGGAVRDTLLSRGFRDVDLAVPSGGLALARYLADHLGGAYYPLDEERGCGRVVIDRGGKRLVIDVADLRGPRLLDDLKARDFSINAMAMALDDHRTLVDPEDGRSDLKKGQIRALSSQGLTEDPLRTLRAVRLAAELGFEIERTTEDWARVSIPGLAEVSRERIRDELMKILLAPRRRQSLSRLWDLGVIDSILPELTPLKDCAQGPPHREDVWNHTLAVVDELERLLATLGLDPGGQPMDPPEILEAFADELRLRLKSEWVVERPRVGLLFLATLLHDVGKVATRTVGPDGRVRFRGHEVMGAELSLSRLDSLRFSRQESQWMSRVVRHHLRPLWLSSSPPISDRARHRFYRAAGDGGPEICLLSLADNRVKGLSEREWSIFEQGLSRLLEGFFRAYSQLVAPPALIRGTDLLARSGRSQGPWVGRVLEEIQEAQAAGEVETREEALALAATILRQEHGDTGA